ncbi:MAG: dTDP-4-dehydrorhamnose 3,5-epimerase [Candidatus Omnitrophica bacterium]|nr:dTDP-4-dehydrorhamnose 3,5-epimerase [Candidatus Omnitrophota bacterium]
MKLEKAAPLPEVIIIDSEVHKDSRGYFFESFQEKKFGEVGLPTRFVQDNVSRSVRNTLRGLHAQIRRPQGKLVRVVSGAVFDVAVDIRTQSKTRGRWTTIELSAENFRQVYVPPGFAHGFCVTSEFAVVEYKCTDFYDPADEITIIWNDPALKIPWPVKDPILSQKDRAGVRLTEIP